MSPVRAAVSLGLGVAACSVDAAMVVAGAREPQPSSSTSRSTTRTSGRRAIVVPAGVPVTFVLDNADPIDHEWIVGDAAVHERHRTGHGARARGAPDRGQHRRRHPAPTTVTFTTPGTLTYVCHLPGHEAYGMTGTLVVTAD